MAKMASSVNVVSRKAVSRRSALRMSVLTAVACFAKRCMAEEAAKDAYVDPRQGLSMALEPARPIIDAHHHLWDIAPPGAKPGAYPVGRLAQDRATSGHNIVSSVYVQCYSNYRKTGPDPLKCVGETEFIEGVARSAALKPGIPIPGLLGSCAAIVGFADFSLADNVDAVLEAHVKASPSRFRGIRQITTWSEALPLPFATRPGMMAETRFRDGFRRLRKYGLTFDAWLFHTQIPELTALAQAFPDTQIVLDHLGMPFLPEASVDKSAAFRDWQRYIKALSACANVSIKLGGLVDPISRDHISKGFSAETRAYYRHAIECFSPRRCIFESNFPVERPACSYRDLWNAYKTIAAEYSEVEKTAMFHDNAVQFYRLGVN